MTKRIVHSKVQVDLQRLNIYELFRLLDLLGVMVEEDEDYDEAFRDRLEMIRAEAAKEVKARYWGKVHGPRPTKLERELSCSETKQINPE